MSLVEMLMAFVLTSFLIAGLYQVLIKTGNESSKEFSKAQNFSDAEQFLDVISTQIRNALQITDGGSPVKLNKQSVSCGGARMPSGITAFPSIYLNDFNLIVQADVGFDPSLSTPALQTAVADGVRIVTLDPQSVPYALAVNTSDQKTYPTNDSNHRVVISDVNHHFKMGNFAVIMDALGVRLIRVTGVESGPGSNVSILHGDASIWNVDRSTSRNYGRNALDKPLPGGANLLKANVFSYAYHPTDQKLYQNTHLEDDAFDAQTQVIGPPMEAKVWRTALDQVQTFKIFYKVSKDFNSRELESIRNPRIDFANKNSSASCANQLGLPMLRQMQFQLNTQKDRSERLVAMGRGQTRDQINVGLVGTPLPDVTPIPGVTPEVTVAPVTPTPSPTESPTPLLLPCMPYDMPNNWREDWCPNYPNQCCNGIPGVCVDALVGPCI